LDFQSNQRPDAQNFDWYWYNVVEAIKGHASEFDRLDSDNDGKVDNAEYADNANQLDGNDASAFADSGHTHDARYYTESEADSNFASSGHLHDGRYIKESGDTMSGTLTLSDGSTAASQSWVNSNADVPNADHADNADQLDGEDASAFADSGHTHDSRYLNDSTGTVTETNLNFDPAKLSDLHSKYTDSEAVSAVNGEGSLSVNISGDADTVDGNHASAFAASGHKHDGRYYTESQADGRFINEGDVVPHATYASTSDVPALNKGDVVFVDGDGLYVEDGI
jgi:hypothetical protein